MCHKRILIITANYTGNGHRSICEALREKLEAYPDVEIQTVDGFSLIGEAALRASKLYGPITRNASDLWRRMYNAFGREQAKSAEDMMTTLIYDRFMRQLSLFEPNLIVTVHPMFNRSVLNILEDNEIGIPFAVMQADIINIHRTWCDPRATLTLCPTEEAYESSLYLHHMPADRLEVCGFPTRAQFTRAAQQGSLPEYDGNRPLNCLLMSGGEGSGQMQKYASQLLEHVNCNVSVICGRNMKLKEAIEEELAARYAERLQVHGFLDDVQNYMIQSDLIIARGSPNTMMEAVTLGVPLMITGSLPGQEADNPALMVSHNLGILCEHPDSVPQIVRTLTANNGRRLREIREAQIEYRNFANAKNIAARLYRLAESG